MGVVLMRLRAQIRTRGRATLALILLVGIAGGLVLAAAAGARRTSTAYDRFLAAYPGADVLLPNPAFGPEFGAAVHEPDDVRAMPQVAAMAAGRVALSGHGAGFAAADESFGFEVPRWRISAGRPYDPARIDEALVLDSYAARAGLSVGDVIDYPGEPPDDVPAECAHVGEGPQIRVRIVGIAVAAGPFFAPVSEDPWSLLLTPAMNRHLPVLAEQTGCSFLAFPPTKGMMWVRTQPGQTDAFLEALGEASPGGFVLSESQRVYDERNRASIRLQGTALWALAIAAALASVLILTQTVARQIALEAEDRDALRALGVSRGQLVGASTIRVALIAVAGAVLAVAIAIVLSPLTPLGAGRLAEPDPGLAVDVPVLAAGASALVAVLVLAALPAAWLAARRGVRAERARPTRLVAATTDAGLPPPVVAGVRMAVEPGHGRSAVPVRSTIAGVALGMAMLTATLTFGASAAYLLSTPRAYGLTIDVWVNNDPEGFPFIEHVDEVHADPRIERAALGSPGWPVQIDGASVDVIAFDPIKGDVMPRVLRGAYPAALNEILLGATTARSLGVEVGDSVSAVARVGEGDEERRVARTFLVSGIGEIPPFERVGLGDGAIVTSATAAAMTPGGEAGNDGVFIGVRPGEDIEAVAADLKRAMGNPDLAHFGFPPPSDVVDFGRVRNLPAILAGIVALIAAGSLGHSLVTAVRRRRRDVAVLKTLGFVRAQSRAAVAWQAATTVLIGAAAGIPLGIVLGRLSWASLIGRFGLQPTPAVPLLGVALVLPAALLLANVIAALPARAAARTAPAMILRAD